jgi:hypothetical protein
MRRTIHSLLVAMDDYSRPFPELQGCINDIDAFASYLSERVAKDKGVAINLKTLENGETTRRPSSRGSANTSGMRRRTMSRSSITRATARRS